MLSISSLTLSCGCDHTIFATRVAEYGSPLELSASTLDFSRRFQDGKYFPLVSSPKGTSASPTRKTRADIATGIPIV